MTRLELTAFREMAAIQFRVPARLREMSWTPVSLLSRELVKFTGNHDYLEHALAGQSTKATI